MVAKNVGEWVTRDGKLVYQRPDGSVVKVLPCPAVFKNRKWCGYNGNATWCDKSPDRCLALDNLPNFKGYPHVS